ncbi:MAG: phospholipase D family protein [Cyclobacteriaceae bacterium]
MGKFLKGNQLNAELEKLFNNAKEFIILISPFIKLHSRFIDALKNKIEDEYFHLVIVFGKNEKDLSKSLSPDDFEFFKKFSNVEIRYERRLHAKYYANENMAILSSMNLYEYSQNNNIEFGIMTKTGKLISDPLDGDAYNYFDQVIENSELLFQKEAQFESKMMGLSSKYIGTEIKIDKLSTNSDTEASHKEISQPTKLKPGYCIRTGIPIPFDPKKPLSDSAYKIWSQYSDENYPEKFCHYSGEKSNGETSFARPILRKNWDNAKKYI